MDFRRSGQLDERRRRVLMDEIASPAADDEKHDAAPGSAPSGSKTPVRAYADAVLCERQPRLTDFVLIRPLHVSVAILAGLTAIAGIIAAYTQAVVSSGGAIAQPLAALDLESPSNLATWWSSLLLAGGAAASLVVYSVRRHRVDDYRGHYRIWLWTAAALLFASADAAAGLHQAIGAGFELLAGSTLGMNGQLGWLSLYALVFGTLAVRLGMEIWNSLPAFATLCGAALLYLLLGLLSLDVVFSTGGMLDVVVGSTLVMATHLTLITAIGLYARHVHLDAQGRLLVSVQKPKKTKPKSRAKLSVVKHSDADGSDHGTTRKAKITAGNVQAPAASKSESSPASTKPAAASAKPQAATVAFQASQDDEDDEEGEFDGQNLSKAERKKLKRLARREQRRAA